jgi:hypothetical protein
MEKPSRDFFNEEELDNAEAAKERERLRLRDVEDLKEILKSPAGRRYIWRMFGRCHTFRCPFVPKDSNATHVNIGAQDIGFSILEDIQRAGTEFYSQMRNEWLSEISKKKQDNKNE